MVKLRCRHGTRGAAWAGVAQLLGERPECLGLPMLV